MTLSREIFQRAHRIAFRDIPRDVAALARLHLLDAIGVGLASAGTGVGAPYVEVAARLGGPGRSSVLGLGATRDAATAAMLNGGLIHGLEYDDTHLASIVHGSAVLAACALAVAEEEGARGEAMLRAYVLGWEVLVRLGLAAPGGFQARGFQVTPVGGALVAALMTAELLGLDEDRSVAAIGIALSQASGVFEFLSNGSSVKSLHPGWAAHAGIVAARLAASGLTGPETAIEGRFGLFRQFAGDDGAGSERLSASLATLGSNWHLTEAAFKLLSCCHYIHPYVEALEQLGPPQASGIASIECLVAPGAAPVICEPWAAKCAPATGHEARWSLPIVLASRIVDGPVGHATFALPASAAVRDMARRISWRPMADTQFPRRFEAEIAVTLTGGSRRMVRIDDVLGGPARPVPELRVREKFRANAALAGVDAAAIERAVDGLGDKPLAPLSAALAKHQGDRLG